MKLPEKKKDCRRTRTGSALLIVLGLLALLMITGVAFAILMRIERSSASNLRHTAMARQLAKGGLAYAIAALDEELKADLSTNRYRNYHWPDRICKPSADARRTVHIAEDAFLSLDREAIYSDQVANAHVLTAETARYLPGGLRYRVELVRNEFDEVYNRPEWIPVRAKGGDDKQDEIIGRYAYVILNTTGLLDANSVHTNSAEDSIGRGIGADAGELQLHPAAQPDVVNLTQFLAVRAEHGRYETVAELATLNGGLKGEELSSLDVFSYSQPDMIPPAPPAKATSEMRAAHISLINSLGGVYDANNPKNSKPAPKIDISSADKIIANRNNIMLALQAAGLQDHATAFNNAQAKWAYLGLLDYVDDDSEPAYVDEWTKLPGQQKISADDQMFARPATEAMPLYSVFAVSIAYEMDNIGARDGVDWVRHTVKYDIRAVYSYPFQTSKGRPFKLEADIGSENGGTASEWEPLLPPLTVPEKVTKEHVIVGPGLNEPYLQIEKTQTLERPITDGKPPLLAFYLHCRASTIDEKTGKVIRRTPANYNNSDPVVIYVGMTGSDIDNGGAIFWSEAIDPRCNWETYHALWRASRDYAWERPVNPVTTAGEEPLDKLHEVIGYPMPAQPLDYPLHRYMLTTPSVIHNYFRIYIDGMRIGDPDSAHCDPFMQQIRAHVADGPMQSVGEMGYLPIGLWLTLHLYDHEHNPPLDFGNNKYPNNVLPPDGFHRVLDYFTLGDPNRRRHGLVNLNTQYTNAVAALFTHLPLQTERNPGSRIKVPQDYDQINKTYKDAYRLFSTTTKRECNDATELAEWLVDKGPYERLSDLGYFFRGTPQLGIASGDYSAVYPLAALKAAVGAGGVGEFEREALIRNICNLVTLRGQTFTIILRADAFSPRFGLTGVKYGNVLATATAVAQVWRDTEPVAGTKNHPTFIQFFKIINE